MGIETCLLEISRFVALVDRGDGALQRAGAKEQQAQREREDLEASVKWLRNFLAKNA